MKNEEWFQNIKVNYRKPKLKRKKNKREITVDSYLEIQWVLKLVRASQVIKILGLVALWQQYNYLWCTTLHRVLQTWFLPGRNVMLLDKWTILEVLIIVLENWSIPDVILFIFLTQNLWLFPDESSFLLFFLCRWKTKRHNVFFLILSALIKLKQLFQTLKHYRGRIAPLSRVIENWTSDS